MIPNMFRVKALGKGGTGRIMERIIDGTELDIDTEECVVITTPSTTNNKEENSDDRDVVEKLRKLADKK